MIDSHTLQPQEDPESLPNLYIIFILEHDFATPNADEMFFNELADGKYTTEEISGLLGIPVESFTTTVNV